MNDNTDTIRIKELDLELIPPSTSTYQKSDQGGSKICVVGKPGCFIAGTMVLMYDGSLKMVQNVQVGDQVMGPDSKPRNVLELCRNSDEMFEIKPKRGPSYIVNLQHKLVVAQRDYHPNVSEMTVENYLALDQTKKNNLQIFRARVDWPYIQVKDPYETGLCLLDTIQRTSFFVSDENGNEREIPSEKKGRQFSGRFIPREYMINSSEVRYEVLAGIIDSDGRYEPSYGRYYIPCNSSFADDLVFLARSLGLFSEKIETLRTEVTEKGLVKSIDTGVIIEGKLGNIPCRILVPDDICTDDKIHQDFQAIPLGFGKYYGFTIDGDHRFLLGSFDVVRNTGKTTLIASLLYAKKHMIPVGMAMSGTEDSNHFYRSIFPSTFVFNNYDEPQVENFVRRQKIAKEHLENPWAVIILDDCTDDPAIFRKPLQNGMYKRGRHWKMWYILSLQYGMDVRPVIRTNIDGVFILREPNMRNRRVMYENYASIIPDFKLFCDILDQITNDFTALYIHNTTKTNNWQDCVFWYKASPVPADFKFGSDDYWDFHYARYNPEYVDPVTV